MSSELAVWADAIGKRYRLGTTQGMGQYRMLREDVADFASGRRRRAKAAETDLWALRNVSFEIEAGERVGIIGRNGAGKTTLLKILAGITPPTTGRGKIFGRVGSLLEVGTGFHPELTGRENIALAGAIMGMRRTEVQTRFDDIVEFSGLSKFLDTPVKRYSSGMYVRLAFSVAAHLEPEVLLVDEVLAVGDAEFQKKCLGRMEELGGGGRTVVFVSHNIPAVLRLCPRVILLDAGGVVADGPGPRAVQEYLGKGGGSATREWPDPAAAPGDEHIRLRSIRVVNEKREPVPEVDVRDPVFVEVEYLNLSEDPDFRPDVNLHFFDAEGTYLFVSAESNGMDWGMRPRRKGTVLARCRVPGNLLAEGGIFISVAVTSWPPEVVHAEVRDAVGFWITDASEGNSVRGEYAGDYPGVVRPMLEWESTEGPEP
jgi:lipopolysaccharide transport system ATP-binding protein